MNEIKHVIDCDADPFVPDGLTVEEHIKQGQLKWDPTKVELFLSKEQQEGSIAGNKLRKELAGKPVLNANILDYLLSHPELIPEKWKGKYIFFWGTIYRHSHGNLYVRCLRWGGCEWYVRDLWLGDDWFDDSPAVLLVS